jgi:hypothetical protein
MNLIYVCISRREGLSLGGRGKVKLSLKQAVESHRVVRRRSSFLDNRLTDDSEVVSLTRRPLFSPQEDSLYSLLLEAESTLGP